MFLSVFLKSNSCSNEIDSIIHSNYYIHKLQFLLFTGEPIDERGPIVTDKFAAIHAEAPEFVEMNVAQEILITGIKVVDLLAPYAKGGKIGNFKLIEASWRLNNPLVFFKVSSVVLVSAKLY